MSYDLPWTNVSNTPFRLYKHWVHEGGIATPFIVHWPEKIRQPGISHVPLQLVDITATVIDAAGTPYPAEKDGVSVPACDGESFLPLLKGNRWSKQKPLFWEHEGNRAIRAGRWKLVSEQNKAWELYDMVEDRTELHDLAARDPDRVKSMAEQYHLWACGCGVLPWPPKQSEMRLAMRGRHIHLHNHCGREFFP